MASALTVGDRSLTVAAQDTGTSRACLQAEESNCAVNGLVQIEALAALGDHHVQLVEFADRGGERFSLLQFAVH